MSEEEPGKILHEVRLDVSSGLSLGGNPPTTAGSMPPPHLWM